VGAEDTRDIVRAEVQEALAPLRDRLDELERSMLETIVRVASKSSTVSAAPSSPTTDLALEPRDIRSRLLSWVQTGDRKRRLPLLVLGISVAVGMVTFFALLASCK
jgi:hypothetical protein